MSIPLLPLLRPGQTPSSEDWNRLVMHLSRTVGTVTGVTGGDIGMGARQGGIQVFDGRARGHWARLTDEGDPGFYAHRAVAPLDDGTFEDLPEDDQNPYGTTTVTPAVEVNGVTGIPTGDETGTVVWVWPDETIPGWRFENQGESAYLPFHARLTSRVGSVWDFVPLALNSSGVYVDAGDEMTGARQLADPDTPLLPAITDIVPGTRVLMRRAATLDGTGEPQYEFRCTLPTVTACNLAPSYEFAIATYGQPEELGLPTVCLGEIELPGPGLYLLYATAYASLRMNGMPSIQYGPNLTCATMYFDADDLGIVDGSHLPSTVLTTLSTSATLDWVGNGYTPSGVAQEVNWGSGTIVFAHRSEDGAAVRLWGHCGHWSGFGTGPGAGLIPAYGGINNVAFGFVPLSGVTINETCNACDSPPPDSGSGSGGGGSETFYCFELGATVTVTVSNKLGTCTGIPDEIELTRYTDPGAYEYEWRGEFTFDGDTYLARITCPSTINPWGVALGLGGETVTPVSQDEDTLTLVWDLAFGVGSACIGSARLTMVGSG